MSHFKKFIKRILFIYQKCKLSNSNFFIVYFLYTYRKLIYRKAIIAHDRTFIKGIKNILINQESFLLIGLKYVGFEHPKDRTVLNIKGNLELKGSYSIGRGTRIDVAEGSKMTIGRNGYINSFNKFIVKNGLSIGDNCVISWDCQFLDDDYHSIKNEKKLKSSKEIKIGNNVWIGCGVKIYQGTIIPNNTVIGANSVVRGVFREENTLIAGHMAKIVKKNVSWNL